jgi:hypothetical protein
MGKKRWTASIRLVFIYLTSLAGRNRVGDRGMGRLSWGLVGLIGARLPGRSACQTKILYLGRRGRMIDIGQTGETMPTDELIDQALDLVDLV